MSELKYNEPAERFAPIVKKSLYAGATASMVPSETGCWVHYVEYCERIANIKSEADKVIAELEMKLALAQQVLRLNTPEALYSNLETMSRLTHEKYVIERRELHQKYKRCLAMAERWLFAFYATNKCNDKFYLRSLKYRELAEKFKDKEAK